MGEVARGVEKHAETCGSGGQSSLWESPMANKAHRWFLEVLGTLYFRSSLDLALTATSCH